MEKSAGEIEANDNMEAFDPLPFDEDWEALREELMHLLHRHKPADSDNILMFPSE